MIRSLSVVGTIIIVIDVVAAAVLFFSRDIGDAATRGVGTGLGVALAVLAVVAALLLWAGRATDRSLLIVLACVLGAAPLVFGVALKASPGGVLGLIYPSMRDRTPREPSATYAFPDAATREAALAIVYQDYAKLDSLLRATPRPDLSARDELGNSLLGMATRQAIADGNATSDLEGLRLLLAAGARPTSDAVEDEKTLLELVAAARGDRGRLVLEMLLDAGLSPNARMHDGRSVLFHRFLTPEAARVLLARGADRMVRDTVQGATDWSPVTFHAEQRNWATALVLFEGGVPRDHGSAPGSVLARVIAAGEGPSTDANDAAFKAFMAAVRP